MRVTKRGAKKHVRRGSREPQPFEEFDAPEVGDGPGDDPGKHAQEPPK